MALTLTEIIVSPGDTQKRQSTWMVTGDGSSYQVNIRDIKMTKVEAAWTENINSETDVRVVIDTHDYLSGPVDIIELGGDGDLEKPISNGAKVLLFVVGY